MLNILAVMKKKIILKRIFHRNEWRYAIYFDYDDKLGVLVKSIDGIKWSQTNKCWYAGNDEESLKQILAVFRASADIDISAISSGGNGNISNHPSILQAKKDVEFIPSIPVPVEKVLNEKVDVPDVKEKKTSQFSPVL